MKIKQLDLLFIIDKLDEFSYCQEAKFVIFNTVTLMRNVRESLIEGLN